MVTYFPIKANYGAFPAGGTVNGSVTFTPNLPVGAVALVTDLIPPVGEVSAPTQASIVNGVLQTSPVNTALPFLLAYTSDLNLTGILQFTAAFKVQINGQLVPMRDFVFDAQIPRTTTDAAMTSADTTLTSATAAFTSSDVGAVVTVDGATPTDAVVTIISVTNSTTVELSAAAGATVSAAALTICQTIDLIDVTPPVGASIVGLPMLPVSGLSDATPFMKGFLTSVHDAAEARTEIGVSLLALDDIVWYANSAAFPGSGVTDEVYGAEDKGKLYLWTGSSYVAARASVTAADITDATASGRTVVTGTPAAARGALEFGFVNVKDYGALGDGTTTDTTAVQAAIDAAQAIRLVWSSAQYHGITVYFPPGTYRLGALTVGSNIVLDGDSAILRPTTSFAGTMITFTGHQAGLTEKLYLLGNAGNGEQAMQVNAGCRHNHISANAQNWGGKVLSDLGVGTMIDSRFLEGMRNDAYINSFSAGQYIGVVELNGTDAGYILGTEINAARYNFSGGSLGPSTNGVVTPLLVGGANCLVYGAVCENGDHSVINYAGPQGGKWNAFIGVRGEFSYGHGFLMAAGSGRLDSCRAMGNSRSADNTGDGFHFDGGTFTFVGCHSTSEFPGTLDGAKYQRYGLYKASGATLVRSAFRSTSDHNAYNDGTTTFSTVPDQDPNVANINGIDGQRVLKITSNTSAVNYLEVVNRATGSPAYIAAQGDANRDFGFQPRGTGGLFVYSPASSSIPLKAQGASTDVGWNLTTQGAGIVKHNGVQAATISDTQALTHKDLTDATNSFPNFGLGVTMTGVKTSAYTAVAGDFVPVDATSGGFTITLPNAPANKTMVGVKKLDSVNTVTVQRSGSDVFNKAGGASTFQLVVQDQTALLEYQASTGIWYIVSHGVPIAGLDGRYVLAPNNGTGNQPLFTSGSGYIDLAPTGPDTNCDTYLESRGSGVIYLWNSTVGSAGYLRVGFASGEVTLETLSNTANKVLSLKDTLSIRNYADTSKQFVRDLSTIPTGVTRKMVMPVSRTSQFSLANSTTETDIITMTLPSGVLVAGTTFKISVRGTLQCQATSGTFAFSPYIGGNVAGQTFGFSSDSAVGPGGFGLDVYITVRTAGASGTYIAHGQGLWTSAGGFPLTSTVTTTTVVDTTAATPIVKLTGKWATASATNSLLVETAVIEQVV